MRVSSYLVDCQSETPTCNCVHFKSKIKFEIQFGGWQLLKKNNPTNNQDNYKPVDFRVNSYQWFALRPCVKFVQLFITCECQIIKGSVQGSPSVLQREEHEESTEEIVHGALWGFQIWCE